MRFSDYYIAVFSLNKGACTRGLNYYNVSLFAFVQKKINFDELQIGVVCRERPW